MASWWQACHAFDGDVEDPFGGRSRGPCRSGSRSGSTPRGPGRMKNLTQNPKENHGEPGWGPCRTSSRAQVGTLFEEGEPLQREVEGARCEGPRGP